MNAFEKMGRISVRYSGNPSTIFFLYQDVNTQVQICCSDWLQIFWSKRKRYGSYVLQISRFYETLFYLILKIEESIFLLQSVWWLQWDVFYYIIELKLIKNHITIKPGWLSKTKLRKHWSLRYKTSVKTYKFET